MILILSIYGIPLKDASALTEMSVGAPSKFKLEYCELLIEHMAKGDSYETFGAFLHLEKKVSAKDAPSRTTLYNWEKEHPEWKETKSLAFDCCQLFWENLGKEGIQGSSESYIDDNGNEVRRSKTVASTGIWALNMRNRFGYKDKVEITTGKDGERPRLVIDFGATSDSQPETEGESE